MGQGASVTRRAALAAGVGALAAGCARDESSRYDGAWLGASHARGHRLRDGVAPAASSRRRTDVVIAGGGIAGLTQSITAMLRAHSTMLTGGLGNPVIATAELGGALLVSLLALAAPLAALVVVILFLWLAIRLLRQVLRGAHRASD
jgi:hypothetical protein